MIRTGEILFVLFLSFLPHKPVAHIWTKINSPAKWNPTI